MAAPVTPSAPPLASCSSQTDFDDIEQDEASVAFFECEASVAFEWTTAIVALVAIVAILCFAIASGLDDARASARASVFQRRLVLYRSLRGVNDDSR